MKCDELKVYEDIDDYIGYDYTPPMMYEKSEVDAAIAELKEVAEDACLERDDNQNVIDELEAENRKLERALWMARAARAQTVALLWNAYYYENNCLYYSDYMTVACNPFRDLPKKTAMEWSNLWESIETKCRAKAEKYK